ncbi:hypothetical protein [Buchananella hordeovulneris]|nr:hypothetical protein [Buchananella hordeovulneris]
MMDRELCQHEFAQAAAEVASLAEHAAPGRVERAYQRLAAAQAALELAA